MTSVVSQRSGSPGPAAAGVLGCPPANSTAGHHRQGPPEEGGKGKGAVGVSSPGMGRTPHPAPHHPDPQSTLKPHPKPVTDQAVGKTFVSPKPHTSVDQKGLSGGRGIPRGDELA